MFLLQSEELVDHASNIIHKETQHHKFSLDLTVAEIHRLTGPGHLDFGGSEFKAAKTEVVPPQKLNKNDDYGWRKLEKNIYRAAFNEQLKNRSDTAVIISPHEHFTLSGVVANTNVITPEAQTEKLFMTFQVPSVGCNIKENARIATLHVLAD